MPVFIHSYDFGRHMLGSYHGTLNVHILSMTDMCEKMPNLIRDALIAHQPQRLSLFIDCRHLHNPAFFVHNPEMNCNTQLCGDNCWGLCTTALLDDSLQVYVSQHATLEISQIIFYGPPDLLWMCPSFRFLRTHDTRYKPMLVKINPGFENSSPRLVRYYPERPDQPEGFFNFPDFDLFPATDRRATEPTITLDES